MRLFFTFLMTMLLIATDGMAEDDKKSLGKFQDWEAFEYQENGQKVCYIASKPQKSEGKYKTRDEVWLMLTHRPGQKQTNMISFIAGYPYRPECNGLNKTECLVEFFVGPQSFYLYTQDSAAWGFPPLGDKMVAAMKSGKNVAIQGKSSRGTDTKDMFSLSGFTAAYQKASEACSVK